MNNAFTVDVEDWYHTMDFNFPVDTWRNYEDRINYGLKAIMEILSKHKTKATFYVLGCVAEKNPELIKEIAKNGHEIGSHGMNHRMVTTQNRNEFREDIIKSKNLLEDIIGAEVNLYRSSSWSIVPKTVWALEILEEEGFICDSSIQPFTTPLSGFKNAPRKPFYPVVNGRRLKLLEFPPSVFPFLNACIPFCGGLYLRTLPESVIVYALKRVNREVPGMIYVHPWELDVDQPRLKVPPHIKFTHYHNLNLTLNKIDKLLENFKFKTMGELIKEGNYKHIPLK